jgi:hypothetical protein
MRLANPLFPARKTRGRSLIALLLSSSLTLAGCLGTFIETPPRERAAPAYQTLRWHLVAAPHRVKADMCENGLAKLATYVPPWGLAIGILTFGIVVPQWTVFSCAEGN